MLNKKTKRKPNSSLEYKLNSLNLDNNDNNIEIIRSNKPLWVQDLNCLYNKGKTFKFVQYDNIEDVIMEGNEEKQINHQKTSTCSPFSSTLSKIFFSYMGYEPNLEIIERLREFSLDFVNLLGNIFFSFEGKKALEFFFGTEKTKFDSYKKIKHVKNGRGEYKGKDKEVPDDNKEEKDDENLIDINVEDIGDINLMNIGVVNLYEDEKKSEKSNNNNNNGNDTISICSSNNENLLNISLSSESYDSNNKYDIFNKEKDKEYIENLNYFNSLTENMSTKEYIYINTCRQVSFLSKGKKNFLAFLKKIMKDNFNKDIETNIEFICFLMKNEIKIILFNAVKKVSNGKLVKLSNPLSTYEIEESINTEYNRLNKLYNEANSNINTKKKLQKKNNKIDDINDKNKNITCRYSDDNKYIKIKHDPSTDSFTYIIKKLIFLKSDEEREFFERQKISSENHVVNSVILLKSQLIRVKNQKICNRNGLRNTKEKIDIFLGDDRENIEKRGIFNYLNVENYYEYYLLKEHILKYDNISLSEPGLGKLNEIIKNTSYIKKKYINKKYNKWLNLDENTKKQYIKEYNELANNNIII